MNVPLFTHLSAADYRFHRLVNNVAIHIYTHDYIRMEITVHIIFENFTASIVDLMVTNVRLLAPLIQYIQDKGLQ